MKAKLVEMKGFEPDRKDILTEVNISKIRPNPMQSRKSFDKEGIISLGRSIRKRGLLQPINIREDGDGFVIVHGERRWRACRMIGMKSMPVIIRVSKYTEDDLAIDQLIENICREDLNVVEKSVGIQSLLSTIPAIKRLPSEKRHHACLTLVSLTRFIFNYSQPLPKPSEKNFYVQESDVERCCSYLKMIGVRYNTVIAHLKILELPVEIRDRVVFGGAGRKARGRPGRSLPFRVAYELSRLENKELILNLARRVLKDNWTSMRVRATVDMIIKEKMQDYPNYRSKKPRIIDFGMGNLADRCFDMASHITNWRRLCLKRIGYTDMEVDKKAGLTILRRAAGDLVEAINDSLEGERAEEKRNIITKNEGFIASFGGRDNRIAIPSKVIKAYGIPSFRSKRIRKLKVKQRWKLKVQIEEAWEIDVGGGVLLKRRRE